MKPSRQRDLFPGALEMMILQTLKQQRLHGYALAQHIKRTSNELLQVEEGSLYPALQRMLKEGWVEAEWGVSATNRRGGSDRGWPRRPTAAERRTSWFVPVPGRVTRGLEPSGAETADITTIGTDCALTAVY